MTLKPVDTAIVMVVGPAIDDTDFKSLEEAIAYNAAGMDISLIVEKTDGTSAVTAITLTTGGTSDWTHKDGGYYEVEVTAVQNAEEGIAYLRGVCTGVLPFESARYEIVKANIYNSLVKGTDRLQIDVIEWLGFDVATPSVSGVPEVDIVRIGASSTSLSDLKDFVDEGYDPTTNKVQGVVLCDTTTTNTDMITGFSTHSAADIWSVGTRALTDKSDFGLSTASINLIWDDLISGMAAVGSIGKLIADNLNAAITSRAPANEYDTQMGYIPSNLGDVPIASELNSDHGAGSWATATGFSTHAAADVWSVATRILTASTNFNDLTAAEVKAEVVAALQDIKLDHLINIAVDTDWATTVHLDSVIGHMADVGTAATFDRTQESMEAIRDRGDAAWVTGAGGSDRLLMVDTTIATLASQTSFTLTAGSADDDAYNNCTIVIEDASTATQKAVGIISNYTGASKTITLKYDPAIFTMATTDKVYILAENALKATLANRQLNVAADGDIAGNVDGSVALVVGHTAQTGDSYAIVNNASYGNAKLVRSTAPANTLDVSATGEAGLDFANIKNATGAHTLTNITVPTVSTLTNKSGFALSATGANLILKDSTFALAMADAMWDEILSGVTHNIAGSAGRRVREIGAYAIESGTAQAGDSHTITLAATASAIDGTYNRNLIVLTDNTGVGQTRTIVDYDGTSKIAIIDRDWRTSPDATTVYQVAANNTPLVVDQGVAQSGTSTTIKLREYASSTNDIYLCNVVAIIAGTGRGQARLVGSYDGTSKVVTICGDNWVTNPDNTSVYVLMPYGTTCTSCIGDYALGLINTECDTALTDYDPPTRTEATTDKDAIITEVNANETKIDALQTDSTAIKAKTDNLPSGIGKNEALAKFDVFMVLSSDHVTGATGKTVAGTISKDGGAFAAITNTITEVSDGMYTIASGFTQAEMNADVVTLKFTADDCDTRIITIHTS